MNSPDGIWNAKDVARYLGASPSWVYQKAAAGLLPSVKLYGFRRFQPEAIKAWARDNVPLVGQVVPLKPRVRKKQCAKSPLVG